MFFLFHWRSLERQKYNNDKQCNRENHSFPSV
jgi:hypothetical protein